MKKNNFLYTLALGLSILLSACSGDPYFSGANQFEVEVIAPEGIKVVGKLWYHNSASEEGDHMSENIKAYIGDNEPIIVNYGRDHVIRVSPHRRYDVPAVIWIPTTYVTEDMEEATLLANKKLNKEITMHLKGNGTIIIGDKPVEMPVDLDVTFPVWKDIPL